VLKQTSAAYDMEHDVYMFLCVCKVICWHVWASSIFKILQTSACHPAANGVAERLFGPFKSMLQCHVSSHPIHWVQRVNVM
jgi:hypothetical protein